MASQQGTVDYLLDQLAGAGGVSAKKMFGEYGLYCDGKMFAIVADDRSSSALPRNPSPASTVAPSTSGSAPCLTRRKPSQRRNEPSGREAFNQYARGTSAKTATCPGTPTSRVIVRSMASVWPKRSRGASATTPQTTGPQPTLLSFGFVAQV